jgi:RDD family.
VNIEKQNEIQNPERAPRKREAPLPSKGGAALIRDRLKLGFASGTGFHSGPSRRKGRKQALWSFAAAFIDVLILISLSSVFLFTFSLIMQSSAGAVLTKVFHHEHTLVLFAEVFMLSAWLYLISIRVLMGSSIGEWACNLRLGQPHERLQTRYILRVALRTSLIVCTGVFTLPLLSVITGRDVPGVLSGLRLFSLK